MKVFQCDGWSIYFHKLFAQQIKEQVQEVKNLKLKLSEEEFVKHFEVKLLAAIRIGIKQKIPQNPFAPYFRLRGTLKRYHRLKKMGLNERYRLFFLPFDSVDQEKQKIIVILWLGFPRKEGDKNDCYNVFSKMVSNGKFPTNIDELMMECEEVVSGF